jgi:FkbM family methyltransferase
VHGVSFDYEKLVEDHYSRWVQSGDTVVDVGSHTGRHLSKLTECVGEHGQVVAFEPLPFAYKILAEAFHLPNVTLHNVALSDRHGQAEFIYATGTPQESGLKERIYNDPDRAKPRRIIVNLGQLDDHDSDLNGLSFIKIDIEGGEIHCLHGARRVIEHYRPVISLEYGFPSYSVYGHNKVTLFDFASENDYILFDVFLNSLEERADWELACDSIYWDYFMVPREKLDQFKRLPLSCTLSPTLIPPSTASQDTMLDYALTLHKKSEDLAALKQEYDRVTREIESLRSSTSWKVTAPLRAVKHLFFGG